MMHGGGRWGGVGPRKPQDARKAFRKSIEWAKPLAPVLVFGLFCTLTGVYLSQQPPRLVQYIIDQIIGKNAYDMLAAIILLYLGVVIAGQLIGSLSGYYMNLAGQKLLHTLRITIYDHFQVLPLSYYDNKRTGDLVSRVTGDVNQLEGLIVNTSNSLVRQIFGVGFALYYMCSYNWHLALLVLIPIPILAVSLYFFTRKIRIVYRSIRENFGEFSAKLMENISGMRVIKAFNREVEEHAAIESTSLGLQAQNIKATRMTSIFYPAIQTLSTLGTVMVLGVGAYMISQGNFTVGKLTAFLMYVANFYQPVGEFIRTFDSIQRALASGERIFEVLDTVPEIQDPAEPVEIKRSKEQ